MFGGQYVYDSIAAMAGAYLFHLAKNHAFVDGNKRNSRHRAAIPRAEPRDIRHQPAQGRRHNPAGRAGQLGKDGAIEFFRERVR
jgi:death-on-curing protein